MKDSLHMHTHICMYMYSVYGIQLTLYLYFSGLHASIFIIRGNNFLTEKKQWCFMFFMIAPSPHFGFQIQHYISVPNGPNLLYMKIAKCYSQSLMSARTLLKIQLRVSWSSSEYLENFCQHLRVYVDFC